MGKYSIKTSWKWKVVKNLTFSQDRRAD